MRSQVFFVIEKDYVYARRSLENSRSQQTMQFFGTNSQWSSTRTISYIVTVHWNYSRPLTCVQKKCWVVDAHRGIRIPKRIGEKDRKRMVLRDNWLQRKVRFKEVESVKRRPIPILYPYCFIAKEDTAWLFLLRYAVLQIESSFQSLLLMATLQ